MKYTACIRKDGDYVPVPGLFGLPEETGTRASLEEYVKDKLTRIFLLCDGEVVAHGWYDAADGVSPIKFVDDIFSDAGE